MHSATNLGVAVVFRLLGVWELLLLLDWFERARLRLGVWGEIGRRLMFWRIFVTVWSGARCRLLEWRRVWMWSKGVREGVRA